MAIPYFNGNVSRSIAAEEIVSRLTPAAQQTIALALTEAQRCGRTAIDTRDILLALLVNQTDWTAQILRTRGVTLARARHEAERLLNRNGVAHENSQFSSQAQHSLETALRIALDMEHLQIDTTHLLLGLIHQEQYETGGAVWLLTNLGVNLRRLDQQIQDHLRDHELTKAHRVHCWSAAAGSLFSYYPADRMAGEIAARISASLSQWVYSYRLGRVFSHTGLKLANEDIHALGIAYLSNRRLKLSQRHSSPYLTLAPDLVVEVRSQGESLLSLQTHLQTCLELGTQVGILINPEEERVNLYRCDDYDYEVTVLTSIEFLTIPDLLPNWKLFIADLWDSDLL